MHANFPCVAMYVCVLCCAMNALYTLDHLQYCMYRGLEPNYIVHCFIDVRGALDGKPHTLIGIIYRDVCGQIIQCMDSLMSVWLRSIPLTINELLAVVQSIIDCRNVL